MVGWGLPALAPFAAPGLDGAGLVLLTGLARWAFLLAPAALAALWLLGGPRDRAAAVASGVATALALGAALILSTLIVEPRPFMDGLAVNYLDHVRDSGFPSDHATLGFAVAFGLRANRPPLAPAVWAPLAALALAVGWARVYLGAHHPIDIAGAALVAAAAVAATASPPGRAVSARLTTIAERLRAPFAPRDTGDPIR